MVPQPQRHPRSAVQVLLLASAACRAAACDPGVYFGAGSASSQSVPCPTTARRLNATHTNSHWSPACTRHDAGAGLKLSTRCQRNVDGNDSYLRANGPNLWHGRVFVHHLEHWLRWRICALALPAFPPQPLEHVAAIQIVSCLQCVSTGLT